MNQSNQSDSRSLSSTSTVPDVPGAIRSWRAWGLLEHNDRQVYYSNTPIPQDWWQRLRFPCPGELVLSSIVIINGLQWWPRNPVTAVCRKMPTTPGEPFQTAFPHPNSENCECGIYGAKDFNLPPIVMKHTTLSEPIFNAFGVVLQWGLIHEHECVYRSQFAYPGIVFIPEMYARKAKRLSEIYRVEVGLYRHPQSRALGPPREIQVAETNYIPQSSILGEEEIRLVPAAQRRIYKPFWMIQYPSDCFMSTLCNFAFYRDMEWMEKKPRLILPALPNRAPLPWI